MRKKMFILGWTVLVSILVATACDDPPTQTVEENKPHPTSTATPTPTSVPPETEAVDTPDGGDEVSFEDWSPWYMPPIFVQLFGAPACSVSPPEGVPFPGVIGITARGKYASLCLYGLDVQVPFMIRLYAPDGTRMAEGSFSSYQQGDVWLLQQNTPSLFGAENPGTIMWDGSTPRIHIPIFLPAGAQAGEWRLQVETMNQILEGSMVLGSERFPIISSLPSGTYNLFQYTYASLYLPGEQLRIQYKNQESRQTQVVDVYYTPDLLLGQGASSGGRVKWLNGFEVQPDQSGFYEVQDLADMAGIGTYILIVRGGDMQEDVSINSCLLPWIACYQVQEEIPQGSQTSCRGFEWNGACWHLGEESASCQSTCDPYGGVNPSTSTYAGSQGSPRNCQEILLQMGLTLDDFFETSQGGIGCFVIRSASGNYLGYWDQVETTFESTYNGRQRVCACQE